MKIAAIGIGNVGFAIANRLQKSGHGVIIAHDNPQSESVRKAQERNPALKTAPLQQAVDESDVVLLSVPFNTNASLLAGLKFNGKVLIDCTNPVGAGITHGLKSEVSGSEMVQQWAADARVVKSFSIYGFENFVDPDFSNSGGKPVMLICGNDIAAKKTVAKLNGDVGFDTLDTGALDQALHLEHMTLLWVKMVRRDGHNPRIVWSCLENQ